MTRAAANAAFIKDVQRWLGVTADGIAGPQTRRAWEARVATPAAPADPDRIVPDTAFRQAFFTALRAYTGPLKQPQVDGFNVLLDKLSDWPVPWIAYAMATAWHETAYTMQPIRERGGDAYFRRMYDIEGERPHVARALGNLHPGDGVRFHGRGYVQLTGRTNYERYGLALEPDRAMEPETAARILKDGMEHGRFTGKKLSDYLPRGGKPDYRQARRIINAMDRADDIAGHALAFERALRAGEAAAGAA